MPMVPMIMSGRWLLGPILPMIRHKTIMCIVQCGLATFFTTSSSALKRSLFIRCREGWEGQYLCLTRALQGLYNYCVENCRDKTGKRQSPAHFDAFVEFRTLLM